MSGIILFPGHVMYANRGDLSLTMGEIQGNGSVESAQSAPPDSGQASFVVGKILPGQGLWGALESISTCDTVRNGVLVVFSPQSSGRLGVFCNTHITGATVDSTGAQGSKGIHELLSVTAGMFCFRPCFGDETAELGQQIALSIKDLLDLRAENDDAQPANLADTLSRIPVADIERPHGDDFLDSIEEMPIESTLVVTFGDNLPASTEALTPVAESKPDSDEGEGSDYFDWSGQSKASTESPNLRKILLPVMSPPTAGVDQTDQINRDLSLYKQVLQDEEVRVLKNIEKTKEKAAVDSAAQKTLDDMQMLHGMLQQQEQFISQRWQGLDEIPTPRSLDAVPLQGDVTEHTHVDSSGQLSAGAPLRAKSEFLSGCEDLITNVVRPTDPGLFLRKFTSEPEGASIQFWRAHPVMAGLGIVAAFTIFGMSLSAQWDMSSMRTSLKEGKENIKAERWSDAIISFNDAIAKNPNYAQAYFYRGIALEEFGDENGAKADFKSAKDHGIPLADVAVAQAGIEIRREEWQKALDICDDAIKRGAKSVPLFRLRTDANLHLGAYIDAKNDCENALAAIHNDPNQDLRARILADRGYAKIQLQDFEGGANDFEQALKVNPDKALFMLKGDAYRKAKRFEDAIEDYNQVLEKDRHNYDAYTARGICEVALGRKEKALTDFGRALEINQNGVEALIQRGSLQLSSGAYRSALDDLQLAWNLNPTIEEARSKLMMAYAQMKKEVPKNLLLTERQSARRKLPSDPKQIVIIGYQLMNNNDLEGASDVLIEAVKRDPNNPNARRYLAHVFALSGNAAAAASQFKALSALEKLTDQDSLTYSDMLANSGEPKKAADILTWLLSQKPDNIPVRIKLARLYYQSGQKNEGDQLAQDGLSQAVATSDKEQLLDLIKNGSQATSKAEPQTQIKSPGTHG
jgi:tetratricopeptide (TPR) repeat protein